MTGSWAQPTCGRGSGSGGSTDHAALTDLLWTVSGHVGAASRIAAFDSLGAASYLQVGVDVQAWSANLDGVAALAGTGVVARTGPGAFQVRAITGTVNRISVTNGSGVSGNPTLDVGSDVVVSGTAAGGDLGGAYPNPTVVDLTISGEVQGSLLYFNGTNWVQLSPGVSGQALTSGGPGADPGWTTLPTPTADHAALSNLSWTVSGHTGTVNRIAAFDGTGAASFLQVGVDVQAWSSNLDGLASLISTGMVSRTGSGAFSTRTITGTAGRVTVTDGDGVAGNPTIDVDPAVLPRAGAALVDFGAAPGDYQASVSVAAAWATAGTVIVATIAAVTTTGHDPEDAVVEELTAYAGTVTPGVGFVLWAAAPNGAVGQYQINYIAYG